jgi:NAD(P)-dependent dehydrogenase (short-subunit alcohol dehydrogenase family)
VAAVSDGGSRVVLVTGGTRGLGKGLVAAFAANGDQAVTCGRKEPDSGAAAVPFYKCDVRDPDQVAALVDRVVEDFGRIDVLINNAGGTPYADTSTMSPRLFERIVTLNLVAPFYVAQRANLVMQEQAEGGVIINIGSTAAIRPAPSSAAYVAAKDGLVGLTRTLALEWAPKVRVVQVTSGLLRTEMVNEVYGDNVAAVEATVPMGRLVTPEEIGAMCVMMASPAAQFVTGSEIIVDGGGEIPSWVLAMQKAPEGQ